MITFEPVANLTEIADWKQAYLQSLVAPLDGYWETAVIARTPHCKILLDGRALGYFAADDKKRLLQFYAVEQADPLFTAVLESEWVETAVAGTNDPLFLSLCLDRQKAVAVNTYLFYDAHQVTPRLPAYPEAEFRSSAADELERLLAFHKHNDECGDSEAIADLGGQRNFIQSLITKRGSFGLYDNDKLLGVGEYRISASQPHYADLGMIVDKDHRRRGVGTAILAHLKVHCYNQNVFPICSCVVENSASRKTIEKAGFVARHRILDIQF
jgi:RimJ/RimL family protein N-acetyltransferase